MLTPMETKKPLPVKAIENVIMPVIMPSQIQKCKFGDCICVFACIQFSSQICQLKAEQTALETVLAAHLRAAVCPVRPKCYKQSGFGVGLYFMELYVY